MLGRVMLAIGGAVVLLLFTALLVPFFVEWSSFRVEFEQQASRLLGKKVSVHGEVDARILPFPSVTLHDVRIGQDVDGKPQVQVARFSMDMELAPLLSGEARIFDMRIEEPKTRLRILKDGTLDWMRGSRPSIPTRVVAIEDVHIVGGEVAIIDEQSGRSRSITGLTAAMSAASLAGPWRGEGDATLDGQEARFSLATGAANVETRRLPLRLRLWPDAEPLEVNLDGEIALSESVPTYSGGFTANVLQEEDESEPVAAPPPGPRVKGSFELTNDRIRVADYRLEVGALDNPYVVTGEATLDTGSNSEFLLTAEGQQIDVNHLAEGPRGKTGRDGAASAQRRLQAFVEMAASIPIPQVPGRASLKLPAVVLNDTTIRDIQLDVQPAGQGWTVDKAVATFPGRTRMEASGALVLEGQPSFEGRMLFASTQPSGLADWLSGHVDPAIRQLRTAGFSANVNLTADLQRFQDLELAIGPATLRGSVERHSQDSQVQNAQPQGGQAAGLSVDLSGDEIDLDAMRALASLITGEDAGMDVLDHRLAARLKAQRFTALGVAASDVDTAFTMAGGVLSLERLNVGDLAGASLSGEGKVEGSLLDYHGTANVRLKSDDLTAFLGMLKRQLPAHPVLDRIAANASFYSDADLTAGLTIGNGSAGAQAKITGSVNGSVVKADIDLPTLFDLTGGSAMTVAASLENPQSEILIGQAGGEILPFGGDGPGTLSLAIQQPAEGATQTRIDFKTERTEFSANAEMSLLPENFGEGRGHAALRSQDLEPYLLLAGIGIPQFGGGLPVNVESDFTVTPQAFELAALRGDADGNAFDGAISIDRSVTGLKGKGALDIDALDLTWLGEAVFGPLTDPAHGAPSTTPFALPVFGNSEIALDLKARNFHAGEFGEVTNLTAKLAHRGGGISLDELSGDWRGGKLTGRVLMSNGNGTGILQTKLHAENADLASLVWYDGEQPVAAGKVTFDASAEASGASASDLIAAMSGSGQVQLSGLEIEGLNSGLLASLMQAADQSKGELTEKRVGGIVAQQIRQGALSLGDVNIPFTITGGEFRVQEVRAQAEGLSLAAEGRANLTRGELDASMSVTYAAGDEAIAGGDPTVRLLYSGKREEPREALDVSAVTNFLSMRAYEQERRRVEMLQSSVLEKQRLRREVALYNFEAAARAAEKARRAEEEERARQAIIEAAKAAERQRQSEGTVLELQVPPTVNNLGTDNQTLEPFGSGTLPGVGQ
ncbi:AsmA family protein [Rhizobium sp. NFR07]|uniref:AsmA family protein n=1 Tax=Rhizobium sp. NFR07 TaxID=1566262 RepID=UPI0008E9B660|nr:AsmA-like C-terminal region-containing protein [Rhizobium sp. NFR07]SFB48840.1 AsmA family protein [Rhizobium sp. NFR07]